MKSLMCNRIVISINIICDKRQSNCNPIRIDPRQLDPITVIYDFGDVFDVLYAPLLIIHLSIGE